MAGRGSGTRGYNGEGSIQSYETKKGTRWRFSILPPRDPEHSDIQPKRITQGGFTSRRECDEALQKVKRQLRRGVKAGESVPTLREWATDWLHGIKVTNATYEGYERNLRRHILPSLGDRRIDRITASDIAKVYRDLESRLSPNTVHKVHVTLSSVLAAAVEDRRIEDNPAARRRVTKPPTKAVIDAAKPEMKVWSAAQMSAFLDWNRDSGDLWYPLWLMYAATGARRSEILALRWSDIDLKTGKLTIRRALDTGDRDPCATKLPKGGKVRAFTLDPAVITELRVWRRTLAAMDMTYVQRDAWVFPDLRSGLDSARPRSVNSTSEMFTKRVRKAQRRLGGEEALPTIHLHEVRHSVATQLIESGVNPYKVASRLGHSSVSITLDIYTHDTDEMEQQAIAALRGGLGTAGTA